MFAISQVAEIRHLNRQFLALIRQNPRHSVLEMGTPSSTKIVQTINSLPENAIGKLVRPAASLLFVAYINDERNEESPSWLLDYWVLVANLARQGTVDRFSMLTGLPAEQYQIIRDTPLHEIRRWAARTQLELRFPAKLWAVLANHAMAGELEPDIAPLIATYSAASGIVDHGRQNARWAA